jgi:hypothetical protein
MTTNSLAATEAECAAGKTAPRVSLSDIEANISSKHFVRGRDAIGHGGFAMTGLPASLSLLTICIVVLTNGFTIIGKSAPADARNFDRDLGQKLAYEDAVRQVWPLMGYELRQQLDQRARLAASALVKPRADMPAYIGTKVVNARPMSRGDYVAFRGWTVPANEDPADAGYLVEYTDKLDGNVDGFAGYITWSPGDVFERAYSPAA